MAGTSVPGNSCRSCVTTTAGGCLIRLSGECVYYSGSNIPAVGVNTGDTFNTVVNKLSNVSNIPIPLVLTATTLLPTPENGALEYDGTNLYFTTGGVRYQVGIAPLGDFFLYS